MRSLDGVAVPAVDEHPEADIREREYLASDIGLPVLELTLEDPPEINGARVGGVEGPR